MSSLVRRIQRHTQASWLHPEKITNSSDYHTVSNPPRSSSYFGRGSKLGVNNSKSRDKLALSSRLGLGTFKPKQRKPYRSRKALREAESGE